MKEGASTLTIIAMITSIATVIFGFSRRVFLYIMFEQQRAAAFEAQEQFVAASQAAASQGESKPVATEMTIITPIVRVPNSLLPYQLQNQS